MEVVLGDDIVVRLDGEGIFIFHRDSKDSITMRDVLYVPRLKRNLILVSTMEDRKYVVIFWDGKVFIHPRGLSETTTLVIGV